VREGDRLRFQTRLLDFDGKRLHFAQRMFHADEGYLASSMESMSMHIDRAQRRVAPFAPAIQARLAAVKSAHDTLEPWPEVGRKVAVKGGKPPSA
jgi:acyl-CoA thioester hydrolase